MKSGFVILAVYFFFFGFLTPFTEVVFADSETDSFFTTEKDHYLEYSDISRDSSGSAYKGVVFGNVISVDPEYRFIFIKPREFDLPRMFIYIDRMTAYTTSKVGFKKRSSFRNLREGDRIAVRVFARNGVIVGDEIFFIEGEYEPPSKYERKTYKATAPAKAGGKVEKKSGGH